MTDTTAKSLYCSQLTEQDLQELQSLQEKGKAKGIHFKIDPGTNSGVMCRRDGHLAGFMTADCFGGPAVESAAIAATEEDWNSMLEALVPFAREKSAKEILFIASPNDELVTSLLTLRGLAVSFSEYRLEFDLRAFSPARIQGVKTRRACEGDTEYILSLDREAFGGPTARITPQDIANTRIILKDGTAAGKLRVDEADGVYGIYGVVVEEKLRNQGIGGQALSVVLKELIDSGASHIYLEVDSENPAAYHLYKKIGFRVVSEFCYYPEKL